MQFEVRIPTYQRPRMLLRALRSLQAQTYVRWNAVVLDDSNTPDAVQVVQSLNDKRIAYTRNEVRHGAAQNIDQCFSPLCKGDAQMACLLEDDNYWLPEFLSLIASKLRTRERKLILANQRINEEGCGLSPETETTRGAWFDDGELSPLRLRASLLLMEGVSNGGLIWRLGSALDLRVGPSVRQTALHEACRTLLVGDSVLFVKKALAVWTKLPTPITARAGEENRVIGRGMQSVRDFVLRTHGDEAIRLAIDLATRTQLIENLATNLAYSGYIKRAVQLVGYRAAVSKPWLKGIAIRCVESNPCRRFLNSIQKSNPDFGPVSRNGP